MIWVSTALTLLNFIWIADHLKIFEKTAIYVRLITRTFLEMLNFIALYLIVIATFGNAMMIIDRYEMLRKRNDDTD